MKVNDKRPLFVIVCGNRNKNATGAIQFSKFLSSLKSKQIHPHIVTNKKNNLLCDDKTLDVYTVKEIPISFIMSVVRKIFRDIIQLPDYRLFSIIPFLIIKSKSILKHNNVSYVLTNSFPCSTHIVGLVLKNRYSIPWIAQFYDPWVNNPYRKYKTKIFKRLDAVVEKKIALNADLIIHSNPIIREEWITRYGNWIADKIYVIPFTYDAISYKVGLKIGDDVSKKNKECYIISHIGNLKENRNLNDLVRIVNAFVNKYPQLRNRIKFRLIGNVISRDIDNIFLNNIEDLFEIVGNVPYDQIDNYYYDSDAFLVLDSSPSNNIFFPSKLMNYFLYKKPIMALTPIDGYAASLLIETGHYVFDNNETDKVVEFLRLFVTDYFLFCSFDRNAYRRFSPDKVATLFMDLVSTRLDNK